MPFERPTLTQLVDRIQTDIETQITGGDSLLRRSVLKVLAKVLAGAVHLLYSYLGFQAEQLFVSSADIEGLEKIADEYGLNRNDATYAIGNAVATGTNGVIIPATTELQSGNGVIYLVDSDATIGEGQAIVALTAQESALDGNQDPGTLLTFVSPIIGINSQVEVDSSGLTGGTNEETDEELRARILLRKQFPPYGGCAYDYRNWMLEYTGVTRSWVFEQYQGAGTVGCTFIMDDSTPYIPGEATIALVRSYLLQHADPATGRIVGIPVTAEPGLFMIPLTEQVINFSISLYPNTLAIRNAIDVELEDLILREGGPGETIYISDIHAALASVPGLERFSLVSPVVDITAITNKIHALGTTTYADY